MMPEEIIPDNLIDWPSFNLGQKRMLEEGYMKKPSGEEVKLWAIEHLAPLNPQYKDFLLMGIDALWQHLGGESLIKYKSDKFTGGE
jgi:hypothetical protein